MIKLINNEFNKIKKSKVIFTYILLIIVLFLMNKYSDKDIYSLSYYLIPIIGIIVCILFSSTICGELERGTLRYYLTKPFKRWKIYVSKILCMIIYILFGIIVVVMTTCLIGKFFDMDYLSKFFLYCIPILFIGVFCIYLSTIIKSQVFVSCFSILTLCFSLIVSQTLFGFNIRFIEYTFLPYLDYSIFDDKNIIINMNRELGVHLSLNRGIIIDLVFIFIFFIVGIVKFNKKDIKSM